MPEKFHEWFQNPENVMSTQSTSLSTPIRHIPFENQIENTVFYAGDYDWKKLESADQIEPSYYALDFLDKKGNVSSCSYFMDEDTYKGYLYIDKNGDEAFDVQRYCSDMQIAPYYEYDEESNTESASYKNHISKYDVPLDENGTSMPIDVYEGTTKSNTHLGEGNGQQFFIPENAPIKRDESFESPVISDEARSVDPEKAKAMLEEGYLANAYAENELWDQRHSGEHNENGTDMRSLSHIGGNNAQGAEHEQSNNNTMQSVADDKTPINTGEKNAQGSEEEKSHGNTMQGIADESKLSQPEQSNTQANDQAQTQENSR